MKAYLLLALICLPASATYTTMTIEGVQQANGVWTTAGVMDTSGFVRKTGQVSVMGVSRNLPVALSADVAASSALMKGASKALGPVSLAITAVELYDWYTSNNLTNVNGQWGIGTGEFSFSEYTDGRVNCSYINGHNTTVSNCFALYKQYYPNNYFTGPLTLDPSLKPNPSCWQSTCTYRYKQESNAPSSPLSFDILWPTSFDFSPHISSRPATDADFNNLPNIPTPLLSGNWSKFPELQDKTPITGTNFTPYSEWLGAPYFKDGNWYRDRMDISPCPTASQPTRVCVDIGPQKFDGETDPNTVPSQATGTAGGAAPKEKAEFCKANPKSIACYEFELGELEPEPLDNDEVQFKLETNQSWGASNSQCPASPKITIHTGEVITFNYQPTCDFLSMIRPFIIAFAILTAIFIAIGRTD